MLASLSVVSFEIRFKDIDKKVRMFLNDRVHHMFGVLGKILVQGLVATYVAILTEALLPAFRYQCVTVTFTLYGILSKVSSLEDISRTTRPSETPLVCFISPYQRRPSSRSEGKGGRILMRAISSITSGIQSEFLALAQSLYHFHTAFTIVALGDSFQTLFERTALGKAKGTLVPRKYC